jgi:glycosyltransferase involved in cell wall biosynthesis
MRKLQGKPRTFDTPKGLRMIDDQDLVSVVVPAYNAEKTLLRTLKSACRQSHENLEIIVVDDGSIDRTAAIVEELSRSEKRLHLIQQENKGVAAARNRGIAEARGKYIAPLDADDIWHPTKIDKQVRLMADGPRIGLVYTWYRIVDGDDRICDTPRPRWARGDVYARLVIENFVGNASSPLIRRKLLEQIGGYNTLVGQGAADLCMQLDIAEVSLFDLVPEYLVGYRRSPSSMSASGLSMLRAQLSVLDHVQHQHPGFPARLLRWSKGEVSAFYGVTLFKRNPALGLYLLVTGVLNDPVGTWHLAAAPVIRSAFRLGGKRLTETGEIPNRRAIGLNFLDADPAKLWTQEPSRWRRKRIAAAEAFKFAPDLPD